MKWLFSRKKTNVSDKSRHHRVKSSTCVLIDFENVVLGMRDTYPGTFLDLTRVMQLAREFCRSKRIDIALAYADWRHFPRFIEHLMSLGIVPVEAPSHHLQGKNGTDIKMCIDATELVYRYPQLETFVLVTGDSDFNALVLTLRQHGKTVIGIGVEGSVSAHFKAICDQYYMLGELLKLNRAKAQEKEKPVTIQKPRPVKTNIRKKATEKIPPKVKEPSLSEEYVEPSAPRDPSLDYLDAIELAPEHVIPFRRLKVLLPLVAETLEQTGECRESALRHALNARFPDKISKQDAGKIVLLLHAIHSLTTWEDAEWLTLAGDDADLLFDGMLAKFEMSLVEKHFTEHADPKLFARLFFNDTSYSREVQMRLARGRSFHDSLY